MTFHRTALSALAGLSLAFTAAAPSTALAQAASAPAAGSAPVSAAKKELVQKVVQLQTPAVENMARGLVERPVATLLQQAGPALQQRVAADKREAVAKEIQADARKYVEEATPIVRERALKLAPAALGPVLEEKLSEDELKQVAATLEMMNSPAMRKFQQLGGDQERALAEKLVAETRGQVEPKLKALEQSVAKRLGIDPAAKPASGPAAKPATAPKK